MARIERENLGQIIDEGKTILDDVSGLILLHVTTRKELYEAEFINISDATKFYLLNPKQLSKFKIERQSLFNLHKRMFDKVWDWAGKKRASHKNIGIPAYKIEEEIQKFTDDYSFWEKDNMDLLELIARLQHKLVWIHPFEGGNGRWSRLVGNIVYYEKYKKLIKWPEEKLQLKNKSSFREQYLEALREADKGRYNSMIALLKKLV